MAVGRMMEENKKLNYIEIGMLPKKEKILVGIPTKNRPEYLSILLSSLLYQTEQAFDVLIADSGDREFTRYKEAPLERFISTLEALGHRVTYVPVPVAGNSEVAAVNFLLTEAVFQGYKYLYKTDDDHVLQPDLLERLSSVYPRLETLNGGPVLVSAITPFMHRVAHGFSGPDDNPYLGALPADVPLTKIIQDGDEVKIEIGHFTRFLEDCGLVVSDLASNANFLMKPDSRILWEDIGHSSMNADAVWMVQIKALFGYKFYFDTGCNSWHVTAPSGGVRDVPGIYDKSTDWDERRRKHFAYIVRQYTKK